MSIHKHHHHTHSASRGHHQLYMDTTIWPVVNPLQMTMRGAVEQWGFQPQNCANQNVKCVYSFKCHFTRCLANQQGTAFSSWYILYFIFLQNRWSSSVINAQREKLGWDLKPDVCCLKMVSIPLTSPLLQPRVRTHARRANQVFASANISGAWC